MNRPYAGIEGALEHELDVPTRATVPALARRMKLRFRARMLMTHNILVGKACIPR